jgi:SAM-dependent methyltransferase
MSDGLVLTNELLGAAVPWGGRTWKRHVRTAIEWLGPDLTGQRILEIGSREGLMLDLFEALGAEPIGVEVHRDFAQSTAERLVREGRRSRSILYSGDLNEIADLGPFDIIYCKSVLVMIDDLEPFAAGLAGLLRPGGRFVAHENLRGHPVMHLARKLSGRPWANNFTYWTDAQIATLSGHFTIERTKRSHVRPLVTIMGRDRTR